jgi:hypothetical protein
LSKKRKDRICIFCGKPPQDKDLEHPLPMWLLRMTGDPNRVVSHPVMDKRIRLSFDSLKFPACSACNRRYSRLESAAKTIVEIISDNGPLPPSGYVLLLDWLDKVRVGLWLGQLYLHGSNAPTHFVINNRIGQKDRMVAIYKLAKQPQGLNVWCIDSPLFLHQPSVLALRINDLYFLNASWDWMCSGRCGYPAPITRFMHVDHNAAIVMEDIRTRRRVMHPVIRLLIPPALLIVQPVNQLTEPLPKLGYGIEDEAWCDQNAVWRGRDRLGPLFRQTPRETIRLDSESPDVTLNVGEQRPTRLFDLVAQAYEWGIESIKATKIVGSERKRKLASLERKLWVRYNKAVAKAFRIMTQEAFKRAWTEATGREAQ